MAGIVSFKVKVILLIGVLVSSTIFLADNAEAASLPPWPMIYSGAVTVGGSPAPDGAMLTAKIGDYTSVGIALKDGRYAGLAVGGPDSTYLHKTISFHLDDTVVANETDVFMLVSMPELKSPFNLTFPNYPTPTPLPVPTATNTPIASPTPQVPGAMVLSGVIELDAGQNSDLLGKEIVARVGSYFSQPVNIEENYGLLVFDRLVVDPGDYKFLGMEISLLVDGLTPTGNTAVFESGGGVDLALRVTIPEPTPVPVAGAPEPTAVVPSVKDEPTLTPTSVPTVIPPTAVPPTAVPPTAVPSAVPPATPAPVVVVVTATPEASEVVVEEEGGSCNLPGRVSGATGTANALMLFSPLLFLAGYRGFRRFK